MKFTGFWKRGSTSKEESQQERHTTQERIFPMQKHQKLVLRESQLCLTVPQKAVAALGISTKRFIEWQGHRQELHGNLLMSESTHTTRIEHLKHSDQYIALVPDSHVNEYGLKSSRDKGPSAICEWDETTLRIRIPLPHKSKKRKNSRNS